MEALCLWKNLCSRKNKKQKKVLDKKEKRAVPKKKERVPFCQENKTNPLLRTSIGGASRWRPDFEQRSRVKTKFVVNKVKNEVSFYLRKYQL